MRAKALFLIALLSPAWLGAQTLAQSGPVALGDGGADPLSAAEARGLRSELRLPFYLSASAQVSVEAEGLRYLDRGPNAAAEAFLDEEYLGPLLSDYGRAWRASRAIKLGPGEHFFTLRNARVSDAEDFVLKRIFVYASQPSRKPLAQPKALSPTTEAITENGCGQQRRDWPEAKKSGITLSVLSGQVIGSGALVQLQEGQTWACGIKISTPYSKPLALVAGFQPQEGISGRFVLSLDPMGPSEVEEVGYKPARWERFQAQLCQGVLSLRFGKAPPLKVPWSKNIVALEIAAQSVEVALRPTP